MENANGADSEQRGQPWKAKAILWFKAEKWKIKLVHTSRGADDFQILYQIVLEHSVDLMT